MVSYKTYQVVGMLVRKFGLEHPEEEEPFLVSIRKSVVRDGWNSFSWDGGSENTITQLLPCSEAHLDHLGEFIPETMQQLTENSVEIIEGTIESCGEFVSACVEGMLSGN